MVSDKRQQELFQLWATLSSSQLNAWIERQPDREALYDLILQLENKIQRRKFRRSIALTATEMHNA